MTDTALDRVDVLDDAPALVQVITDQWLTQFEKQVSLYGRYLSACMRLTNTGDWINQGGKYFLQCSGAEKLANPLGITWAQPFVERQEHEDDKGKFYGYLVSGIVESRTLKRSGWFLGTANSRDQFFNANRNWNPSEGAGDILKSAYSNFVVNAVTRLAGIRNPSPEMLKQAGIDLGQVGAIDYGGGAKHEGQASDKISEAQRKRFYSLAKKAGWDDEPLKAWLTKTYGWEHSADITKAKYDEVCQKVQETGGELREPGAEG